MQVQIIMSYTQTHYYTDQKVVPQLNKKEALKQLK